MLEEWSVIRRTRSDVDRNLRCIAMSPVGGRSVVHVRGAMRVEGCCERVSTAPKCMQRANTDLGIN